MLAAPKFQVETRRGVQAFEETRGVQARRGNLQRQPLLKRQPLKFRLCTEVWSS